mgnify:CR=1 FL=1|tara:strand:+ start:343 stop:564 length:222 start_codon:yes stop_codon:yes gene_type:complete
MKTKLKDIILYSLAIVGVVSLFINATNPQPAPPKFEIATTSNDAYLYDKETGEVWAMKRKDVGKGFAKIEKLK